MQENAQTKQKLFAVIKDDMESVNTNIHPTAIIEDGAVIEDGVKIGPYCIVGKDVVLKRNVVLKSHVVVTGKTTIGEGTEIYEFAVIGEISNDMKYYKSKEYTDLKIGKNCVIRESCTIHMGTPKTFYEAGMMSQKARVDEKQQATGTVIGDNVVLLQYVHVGHDCVIGDNVLASAYCKFAGEVYVKDFAIVSGDVSVAQFCTIGKGAFITGSSGVLSDVPPYCLGEGYNPFRLRGLNLVGLKRANVPDEEIRILKNFYRDLFMSKEGVFKDRLARVKAEYSKYAKPNEILQFIEHDCRRSLTPAS
ncbi:MAG: acyl-ACP--UDP-N-acetylglucosamine O-acyltransferase [Rickettsiales bacterium]|jgi:UDP-N-acetylglucosamine acyltransferase|nr:acyl-ACP--UDP-N-acetylglucosamine O-acyltransferase [Rickettsiales bacterium]